MPLRKGKRILVTEGSGGRDHGHHTQSRVVHAHRKFLNNLVGLSSLKEKRALSDVPPRLAPARSSGESAQIQVFF